MRRNTLVLALVLAGACLITLALLNIDSPRAVTAQDDNGCVTCHDGIEPIRDPDAPMMMALEGMGGCVACHGGDKSVTDDPTAAHSGNFYPDPGSLWIEDQPCKLCHADHVYALGLSLMNTEAGKIQGNLWAWGLFSDHTVRYANYTLDDDDGAAPRMGTDAYVDYMTELIEMYPDQFPMHVDELPNPTLDEIEANPALAAYTYQREECQRCHVGNNGRNRRGDYRGLGCSSCHIPYSNDGFYEGDDPTIPTEEAGHLLVHSMQATQEARGGIPTESCVTCHNRGKRIGVSYQGLMEFPYDSPVQPDGSATPKLHTKKYQFISDDLHHQTESRPGNPEGGLLCQDCHTSIEMHGDGTIFGTTLAQVEIECTDCHGITDAFPWELPLGYSDEFGRTLAAEARGVTDALETYQRNGTLYDVEDGYLLTARGNAFGNVVRRGDQVIVHSATGLDFFVPQVKAIAEAGDWRSADGAVAMESVATHMDAMECYACHADWAPQCYGCHVTVNYGVDGDGNPLMNTDWVAVGNTQSANGLTAEADPTVDIPTITGRAAEPRSYLRWEAPILGATGEGRVTPLIPGCQVIYTVIGVDGATLAHNAIGRTDPFIEGGDDEGQRGMDMAPAQPHTSGRQARRCESCHGDPKALGYGIDGGRFMQGYDEGYIVDLEYPDGTVMPEQYTVQINPITDLPMDLSQIVDPATGQQLMTVGSHWPGSGPLNEDQRTRMERTGVCMGCHQNMIDETFWTDQVIAQYGEIITNDAHIEMMNQAIHDAVQGD
ncbi:MAG: cytochrome C [Anaerolineae bacterium]|nr:cytochrome C [Anaerolineae bacterium]